MEEKQTAFGQRLAGLRQARGLSQQALADRLAVTRQAVSNWERSQTIPDLDMLRAMTEALDVDMNTLCGLPEPKAPGRTAVRSALSLALCGALCLSLGLGGGLWLLAALLRPPRQKQRRLPPSRSRSACAPIRSAIPPQTAPRCGGPPTGPRRWPPSWKPSRRGRPALWS